MFFPFRIFSLNATLHKSKDLFWCKSKAFFFCFYPSGAVAYRVVQFGTDGGVDAIPQGAVQNTVPNLLTATQMNGSPSDSSETRLALITSDVPTDGNSAVVVSGGTIGVRVWAQGRGWWDFGFRFLG